VLSLLERQVRTDIGGLDESLESLSRDTALDVFPFDASMLEKTASLALEKLDLQPFDQAVLAAILVRSGALRSEGASEFAFCELDADLQPWDKQGKRKEPLTSLYDAAGVWVYGDFVLKTPQRPDGWTGGAV
jgi:hypothetical protein